MKIYYSLLLLLIITQIKAQSVYNPRQLFPAQSIFPQGNEYRTATGKPGPAYWQNQVDYNIDATLSDTNYSITAREKITYTNNSPETLNYLWLQLDEDAFKQDSRARLTKMMIDSNLEKNHEAFSGGYHFTSVKFNDRNADYTLSDARMKLMLPQPLPTGKKVEFTIEYHYTIPRFFYNNDFNVNRTDVLPTKNGDIFSITQWYPRLCVLDDVEGWNTLPFLGNGEFYLEYGNFDVNITAPAAMIVQASGELLNPEDVLTKAELQRWKDAHNSETPYFIRKPEEVTDAASRPAQQNCTWKFAIKNSRDFAFTASKSFVWEGININLPEGKKALGISVYPVESLKPESWQQSSEIIKTTIEYFSKKWFVYPYPCAVNVASNLDGMEFPGIVFCSAKDTGDSYWRVVNHELGHTWFPMIVGSNERKFAWMDEGFNSFIDNIYKEDIGHPLHSGYEPRDRDITTYFADSVPPIFTRPDGVKGDMVFHTQYLKTTYLLRLLRDKIIGKDLFDAAFKQYTHDWAFKHPTPYDFFNSINNGVGEDLTWFWKANFIENYALDQSIKSVKYKNGNAANGAEITIENLQKAAMPVIVDVKFKSGKTETYKLPVEVWETGSTYILSIRTAEPITEVMIDPKEIYPDVKRSNNVWKSK